MDATTLQRLFTDQAPLANLLEQVLNQVLEAQVTDHRFVPYAEPGDP